MLFITKITVKYLVYAHDLVNTHPPLLAQSRAGGEIPC